MLFFPFICTENSEGSEISDHLSLKSLKKSCNNFSILEEENKKLKSRLDSCERVVKYINDNIDYISITDLLDSVILTNLRKINAGYMEKYLKDLEHKREE